MGGKVWIEVDYRFLKDRKADMRLYAYSRCKSVYVDGKRSLALNLSEMGRELGVSRQTLSKRLEYLRVNYPSMLKVEDTKVVMFDGNGFNVVGDRDKVLKLVVEGREEDVRVYFYLRRQDSYWRNVRGENFDFSLSGLSVATGYCNNDYGRDKTKGALERLEEKGLVRLGWKDRYRKVLAIE